MNTSIVDLLKEQRTSSAPYGCLMAKVSEPYSGKIVEFGRRIISEGFLYTEGIEYGRENTPHVTIKYGFEPDLTEIEIRRILKGVSPFSVNSTELSLFENNPKYDVVKLGIQSPILENIRKSCDQYPNKDEYPKYNPHLTLAYVKKGSVNFGNGNIKMALPIKEIYYSPSLGEKSYFNL